MPRASHFREVQHFRFKVETLQLRVDSHYATRHHTTRQNILLWFSHARIRTSPSPTANDKDNVVGTVRREYIVSICLSLHVMSVKWR
jgi:hypothetical protein